MDFSSALRRIVNWPKLTIRSPKIGLGIVGSLTLVLLVSTGRSFHQPPPRPILKPPPISEWQTKTYAISDDYLKVFPIGEANPPKGWKPDLTRGLDVALPFPWPEAYLNRYKQPFNPWAFFRNALALCSHWKQTKNFETRKLLEALHKRLLEYSELHNRQRFLLYKFPMDYREQYKVNVPWTSAYASGAALIGLASMYKCADMPEALATAKEVLTCLGSPIDPRGDRPDLWVSFLDEAGYLWFEEKPLDQVEQPRILNGHIRALTGLYIYWVHTRDETALHLLRAGIKTVENYAPRYRKPGGINAYDMLQPYVADYGPQRTIGQQDMLFKMTGDPIFARYRDMFDADMRDEIEQMR